MLQSYSYIYNYIYIYINIHKHIHQVYHRTSAIPTRESPDSTPMVWEDPFLTQHRWRLFMAPAIHSYEVQ